MNKKSVLDFILIRYEKEEKVSKEVLQELKDSLSEIEAARSLFNLAEDSKLIEAAIYREEAARRRFDYFFNVAKEEYGISKAQYTIEKIKGECTEAVEI